MHTASVTMLSYKVRANILLQHCYMRAKGLSYMGGAHVCLADAER